jgi:Fe-S oxidoreductase
MAKMKIEVLAARAARHGVPLRDRLIAELPRYASWAARFPGLANLRNQNATLRALSARIGLAPERDLPAWRPDPFDASELPQKPALHGDVWLFADTFNRYFEPENLRAAVRVLGAAGFRPIAPPIPQRGRPLCCGRTYLSAGLIDRARAEATRTLAALAGNTPVVGLEPACLLTLRDEFLSLLPGAETAALAKRTYLLGEFLTKFGEDLVLRPQTKRAAVHGHCHQKAHDAFPAALNALRTVPGLQVSAITSSCCGMAGAFGYQAETQSVSRTMAEASLLPAIRALGADDLVVADGTSCRQQIRDLGGRNAVHSVRVLAASLEPTRG